MEPNQATLEDFGIIIYEVKKRLMELDQTKAVGPDKILPRILRAEPWCWPLTMTNI